MSDRPQVALVPVVFTHFPLPYRDPGMKYVQQYPEGEMTILSSNGVPFGKAGRSLISMVTTQALLQNSRVVELGHVSEAFRKMNLVVSGGKEGTVTRVREQFDRFYGTMISLNLRVKRDGFEGFRGKNMILVEETELYWSSRDKDIMAPGLFQNTATLSEPYFNYIKTNSTPVDLLTYHSFISPRDQDWYAWLSRKIFAVVRTGKESIVPWESLYLQFGPILRNNQARFRRDFVEFMKVILIKHPDVHVKVREEGVLIEPSPLLIPEESKGFVQT